MTGGGGLVTAAPGTRQDLPKLCQDWDETEASILGLRPRPRLRRSGPRQRHFSRPYVQVNCGSLCLFKDTMMMTSSNHTLILSNWNKHRTSSWHYQESTHHIFSNEIQQLSLTWTVLKLWVGHVVAIMSGY